MKAYLIVPLAGLALTACNKAPSVSLTNASVEQVVKAANPVALGIKPGRWEHKVELLDIKSDTVPPQMIEAMKASIASTAFSCVTPEQASKGAEALLSNEAIKKMHCKFDKAEFGNGAISTAMSCNMPSGTLTVHSTGTYSATDYAVDGESTMTGKMGLQEKTRTTGKWVGECNGTEGKSSIRTDLKP
jgi:hypothetical protein